MRSIEWRISSTLYCPAAMVRLRSAKMRRSQSAWKTGSFSSRSIGPKPCIPPRSWIPFIDALRLVSGFDPGNVGANHGVAGDKTGEPFFAPALGAGRPHRQHHVTDLGVGVPNAYLDVRRYVDAELGEHLARL